MKRDMDLVRKILLSIENDPSGYVPDEISIEGYTQEEIGYHVLIMIDAGLLSGEDTSYIGGRSPSGTATRMTWQGHEFLDSCREETRWDRAKRIGVRVGGLTFEMMKRILLHLMEDQVRAVLG